MASDKLSKMIPHPSQTVRLRPAENASYAVVAPVGRSGGGDLVRLSGPETTLELRGPAPSASRLVSRHAEDRLPLATIRFPLNGGAIRNLIGQGHAAPIGIYPSWKNGRSQPWHGLGHRQLLHLLEVDPTCVDYQSEPFTISVPTPEGVMDYTPDVIFQTDEGPIVPIEYKHDRRGLAKTRYRMKIAYAFAAMRTIGWHPVVRYAPEVYGSSARVANVDAIQGDRTAAVDLAALDRFEALASAHPSTTFGRVLDALSRNRLDARAWAHAMICDRRIRIDLDASIIDAAPVTLLPDRPIASRIRFH